MKSVISEREIFYDGSQLRSQFIYLNFGVMGPAILSFTGPCDVKKEFMADGEDLLSNQEIRGHRMLHFMIEVFELPLIAGVLLQRYFSSLVKEEIERLSSHRLEREGDDLFFAGGKLSISIAARSPLSVVIHFALNITNEGTPVKTSSLEDLGIDPHLLIETVHERFCREYATSVEASWKAKAIP